MEDPVTIAPPRRDSSLTIRAAMLASLAVTGSLLCGTARAAPGWGVLVSAEANGTFGIQDSVLGTGNYSGSGPVDPRTSVSVTAISGLGIASAYADLSTGKAGAFSNYVVIDSADVGQGISSATWVDSVRFRGALGGAGLVIPISMTLDGTFPPLTGSASVAFDIYYTAADGVSTALSLRGALSPGSAGFSGSSAGWNHLGLVSDADISLDTAYPVQFFFSMDCNLACDFLHTATFDWSLPEGVTYTSASGVFLAAALEPPGTAVPEPAAGLLFLTAASVLVASRIRKQGLPLSWRRIPETPGLPEAVE